MDGNGLGEAGAPVEATQLSGGIQNTIYGIRRGDLHAALRIPPPAAPPARDPGIVREWRLIDALAGTDVPHTEAIALCEDATVLGRPFYLMGFVDGWSPMGGLDGAGGKSWPEPFESDLGARRGLAYALVEGIAQLAKVDWRSPKLEGLGRPDGFHDRQVDRWLAFLDRVKGREIPGLDEASAWLRAHRPIDFVPGIMHGDYQFANVMFAHGAPARLAAIVDWEMGTVGDPKLDLAWVVARWPEDTSTPEARSYYVDLTGMPGASELVRHYGEVAGRQVDDIDYYVVLARWKLAIVLEQGFQRGSDNPRLASLGPYVLDLMRQAAELAGTSDYKG
jgi:aminoglycoside phosphotransferase (APT) family kinase protein